MIIAVLKSVFGIDGLQYLSYREVLFMFLLFPLMIFLETIYYVLHNYRPDVIENMQQDWI